MVFPNRSFYSLTGICSWEVILENPALTRHRSTNSESQSNFLHRNILFKTEGCDQRPRGFIPSGISTNEITPGVKAKSTRSGTQDTPGHSTTVGQNTRLATPTSGTSAQKSGPTGKLQLFPTFTKVMSDLYLTLKELV